MLLGGITLTDFTNISGTDTWATIDEQLHGHTPELGDILVPLVRAKTPVLTLSLFLDMTYEAYTDPEEASMGEEDLLYVYASGENQLATWDRIYVQYQEGGALGLPTYTNPPREMFAGTAETDGLEATADWALAWVEYADLLIVSGAGVPL